MMQNSESSSIGDCILSPDGHTPKRENRSATSTRRPMNLPDRPTIHMRNGTRTLCGSRDLRRRHSTQKPMERISPTPVFRRSLKKKARRWIQRPGRSFSGRPAQNMSSWSPSTTTATACGRAKTKTRSSRSISQRETWWESLQMLSVQRA